MFKNIMKIFFIFFCWTNLKFVFSYASFNQEDDKIVCRNEISGEPVDW